MDEHRTAAGWAVGRSAAVELDLALAVASGLPPGPGVGEEIMAAVEAIPAEWRARWRDLLGEPRRSVSILEDAAALAGTLLVGDYREATLAIRELTAAEALAPLAAQAACMGLTPDPALAIPARLADLAARLKLATYAELGFELPEGRHRWLVADVARAVRILRDGDLHARFWQWLDQFYYAHYRPWREAREPRVAALERRAEAALGGRSAAGVQPATAWLPAQNPLLRLPELRQAVADGRLSVFFLAEPFGIVDLWELRPGLIITSFAPAGESFRDFQNYAESVAGRLKALSDPTRLVILRIIRHFGRVNSEIADYLGLAQPTVSVHAKVLREAGLIRSRQEGRVVRHEVDAEGVRRLLADLETFLDLPQERAD